MNELVIIRHTFIFCLLLFLASCRFMLVTAAPHCWQLIQVPRVIPKRLPLLHFCFIALPTSLPPAKLRKVHLTFLTFSAYFCFLMHRFKMRPKHVDGKIIGILSFCLEAWEVWIHMRLCSIYDYAYAMQIGHLMPLGSIVGKVKWEQYADGRGQRRLILLFPSSSSSVCPSFFLSLSLLYDEGQSQFLCHC